MLCEVLVKFVEQRGEEGEGGRKEKGSKSRSVLHTSV